MSDAVSEARWRPETSDHFLKSLVDQQVAILTTAPHEGKIIGTLKVVNDDCLIIERAGTQVLVVREAIVAVYKVALPGTAYTDHAPSEPRPLQAARRPLRG